METESTGASSPARFDDLLRKAAEGHSTAFDVVDELSGDGKRLEIIRRKLQPESPESPIRAESKRRDHTFHAVSGFVDYLECYGSDHTVVFADADNRKVQAVLDEEAESGREVIDLAPQTHPRWQPWRQMLGQKIPLAGLFDLVRQNRRAIVEPEGRGLILSLSQVRCSTEVVLHAGQASGKADALNGITIRTKIQGREASENVALPDAIKVLTPVWVDEESQEIEMDLILGAKADGTEVWCQLASADIREAEIAAFDGLVEHLRKALTDERFTVTHGAFGETEWGYLRSGA